MKGTASDVVRSWVSAYVAARGEDMVAVAHEEIVVRPRVGQGERVYHGHDGIRAWLACLGTPPPFQLQTVEELDDGRVVVEGTIDTDTIVALFQLRDQRIVAVVSYVSDRELLERLGRIPARVRGGPPGYRADDEVSRTSDSATALNRSIPSSIRSSPNRNSTS